MAKEDTSYYFTSAGFFETGIDGFGFLNNFYTVFYGERMREGKGNVKLTD